MTHDVFISYSRTDAPIADDICKAFDNAGINYWIDRGGITSGEAFHAKIVAAIRKSKITVFVSSMHSNMSQHTIKEIVIAFNSKKHIIPFCIDEEPYADKLEYYLCDLDRLAYYLEKEFAIQRMIKDIQTLLGNKEIGKDKIAQKEPVYPELSDPIDSNLFEAPYQIGKEALLSYDMNTAFSELLIPALNNYKDSQVLLARIARNKSRLFRVSKDNFDIIERKAQEGNPYAQYLAARYYGLVKIDWDKNFEFAQKSASADSPFGIGELAECYYFGTGTSKNFPQALELYKKGLSMNNLACMYLLGREYVYGWSMKANPDVGIKLLRMGEKLEDPQCINEIGNLYLYGDVLKRDKETAEKYYKKALELGYIEAYESLGSLYLYDIETNQYYTNIRPAIELFLKGAKYSEPGSLCRIANIYYDGVESAKIKKDPHRALKYYLKAANAGDNFSMYMIGNIYYYGNDEISPDELHAWEWFTKGARYVNGSCIHMLGIMCQDGYGQYGKNKKDAVSYFEEAAYSGNTDSMLKLYEIYSNSDLIEKDEARALKWLQKAAERNMAEAMYKYGKILVDSHSPHSDEIKGVELLEKAVNAGYVDAALELSKVYATGIGIFKDTLKAKEILERFTRKAPDNPQIFCELGKLYSHASMAEWDIESEEEEKDEKQKEEDNRIAREHFLKAAEMEYPEAYVRLAELESEQLNDDNNENSESGKNYFKWINLAVEKEYPQAILDLGICYQLGIGTSKDLSKAMEWYRKSADTGNIHAPLNIAKLYMGEDGYPKDVLKASKWLLKAKGSGNISAQENLEEVAREIELTIQYPLQPEAIQLLTESLYGRKKDTDLQEVFSIIPQQENKSSQAPDESYSELFKAWNTLVPANRKLQNKNISELTISDLHPFLSHEKIFRLRCELAEIWLTLKQKDPTRFSEVYFAQDDKILDIAELTTDNVDLQLLLISLVECKIELEGAEIANETICVKYNKFRISPDEQSILDFANTFYKGTVKNLHIAKHWYEKIPDNKEARENLAEINRALGCASTVAAPIADEDEDFMKLLDEFIKSEPEN